MLDKGNVKCTKIVVIHNNDNAEFYRLKGINTEHNVLREKECSRRSCRAVETTWQDQQQCSRSNEVPTLSNELSSTISYKVIPYAGYLHTNNISSNELTLESSPDFFCGELDEQSQQINLNISFSIEQNRGVSARSTQTSPVRNDLAQPTHFIFTDQ